MPRYISHYITFMGVTPIENLMGTSQVVDPDAERAIAMDTELIASIDLGDRVFVRFYSDGSIHLHDEEPFIGRGVGMDLDKWKRLNKLLNSIEGAGFRKISGGYNRELGMALEKLNQSLKDEEGDRQ